MAIMHVNFQIKKTQLLHLNHPITKSLLTTPSAMTWNMMDIKIRSSDSPLNLGGLVDHVLIKIFCANYLAWINWKEFDFVNFSNPSKSFILQSYFYFYRSYNFFIFLLIRSHSICFYGCLSFLLCFAFLCFTCWLFFFSFFLFFFFLDLPCALFFIGMSRFWVLLTLIQRNWAFVEHWACIVYN